MDERNQNIKNIIIETLKKNGMTDPVIAEVPVPDKLNGKKKIVTRFERHEIYERTILLVEDSRFANGDKVTETKTIKDTVYVDYFNKDEKPMIRDSHFEETRVRPLNNIINLYDDEEDFDD